MEKILHNTDNLNHLIGCTLTYGHFSSIHPGHIRYLNYAKKKGNLLVVALLGDKDFSSFQSANCQSKTSSRTIYSAEFTMNGEYILFKIKGNAFLQNMIRIMVGTLIEVGKENISVTEFKNIINAKNRKKACKTVSPDGLYFTGPEYNSFTYTKNKVFLDELD